MAQIVQDVEGPMALRSVNIVHGLSGRPAQLKEGIIPASRSPWSVGIRGAIHNLRYTNRLTFRCAIKPIIARRTDVRKRPFSPLFLARIHRTGLDDLWALATGKSTAGFRTRPAPYQSS